MQRAILWRTFVLALALLCHMSMSLAQKDQTSATPTSNNDKQSPASPTPTATQDKTKSPATNSGSKSGTANASHDSDTPTGTQSNSDDSQSNTDHQTTADSSNTGTPTQSFDESYEETGMAQRLTLATPDLMTVPTPMFQIGSQVVIAWTYNNETLRPPKKLNICGQLSPVYKKSRPNGVICDWDIVANLTGSSKNYTWNTVTQGSSGVNFIEATGYTMYIYDAEYGISNNAPGAGRMLPFQFPFSMYNSRYGKTNQDIPAGYNPSAAPAVRAQLWTVLGAAALGILGMLA